MPVYTETGALNVVSNDTTKGRYSPTGALRVNLVSGASYTGLYAADGALNVVDVSGVSISTYGGLYHPCGALRGRTAPDTFSGLQAPDGSYYLRGLFSPLNLFSNGEVGGWYDPSDLTTLFQDAAGTTPVTAVEQPVGLVLDKSGQGNHLSQSTSTARPVLSARVNMLTRTEEFDNAVWTKTNTTVTQNVSETTDPTGANKVAKIVQANGTDGVVVQTSVAFVSGTSYTASIRAKKENYNFVLIALPSAAFPASNRVGLFNLDTGTVATASQSGINATINPLGNGWYECSITQTANATATNNYVVGARPSDNLTSTGNGSSGIYIWGADLRPSNAGVGLPAYQRVTTSTDYDTTGFPLYLRDDLTDDTINWTAPAGTYTVSFVDRAGNVTIETSQSLSGTTDALRVERLGGYLAINRALTASETASLTAWFKTKVGAPA